MIASMNRTLVERIIREAKIVEPTMIKVDGFLNHRIDVEYLDEIASAFAQHFQAHYDLILTLEASGIALAVATAQKLKIPVLFAKKGSNVLHQDNIYHAKVFSATKQKETDIYVSKDYLKEGQNILILDDFLSNGDAILGLFSLVSQAKANCSACGIVIEKSFNPGRSKLEEKGLEVFSLVRVKAIQAGKLVVE